MIRDTIASAHGIRRGFSLANAAGTYAFARENPATSCALVGGRGKRAARRTAASERARKFRRRERAGLPGAGHARWAWLAWSTA
ncbi:MAG: hypothetical protein AB7P44_12640 [Steroidobacteraceae bacterium]